MSVFLENVRDVQLLFGVKSVLCDNEYIMLVLKNMLLNTDNTQSNYHHFNNFISLRWFWRKRLNILNFYNSDSFLCCNHLESFFKLQHDHFTLFKKYLQHDYPNRFLIWHVSINYFWLIDYIHVSEWMNTLVEMWVLFMQ